MGLWSSEFDGTRLGWRSPVRDGPVNPAFVNLQARGGLGWLSGFDETMVRCGLESNGAPYTDESGSLVTLHGKIANIPAHRVSVSVDERPPYKICVTGEVDEAELFFTQMRMKTTYSTEPGSNRLTVRDEVTNTRDQPGGFVLVYHWNFGPPLLEQGSLFFAPVKTVCPKDARAAEGLAHRNVYGPPEPGFVEQVYLFDLLPGPDGRTVVLLRNRAGDLGIALRHSIEQLPCFTLWKCTQGIEEGYVTGLEPGVNYPNPTPFEERQGRVRTLEPGQSHVAETAFEVLSGPDAVKAVEAEIAEIQKQTRPTILPQPVEPFAPGN
jgi:galactose mutarotase-like enzyme